MDYSDFELARMQVDALFVHDANGRLLRVNEPEPEPISPAPRFFMARTATGNLWRTRYDLPGELTAVLERLAADEPVVGDLGAPLRHTAAYADLLTEQGAAVTESAGPAYVLPELDAPREAVMLTAETIGLVEAHFSWLLKMLDVYAPVAAVVVDGAAVAVCFCARITGRVAEAGVYTEANFRGRGYAAETVRCWAAGIRAVGRLPLYSTSRENGASQQVARKLGAVQYGVDYNFG